MLVRRPEGSPAEHCWDTEIVGGRAKDEASRPSLRRAGVSAMADENTGGHRAGSDPQREQTGHLDELAARRMQRADRARSARPSAAASDEEQPKRPRSRPAVGPLRVAVIGRDQGSRDAVASMLGSDSIVTIAAGEDRHGLDIVKAQHPDIVVIDRAPASSALEFAHLVTTACEMHGRVIMLSDLRDPRDARAAYDAGVAKYLTRPVEPEQLTNAVREAAGEKSSNLLLVADRRAPVADRVIEGIAHRLVDAYNRRDRAAWVGIFHPDMEFQPTMLIGARAVYRGHNGAKRYLDELRKRGVQQQARIRELRRIGPTEFALLTDILLGSEIVSPGAVTIRLQDDKIIEARAYLSDPDILASLDVIPHESRVGSTR
jgi:CheY-like chemotaxis protein